MLLQETIHRPRIVHHKLPQRPGHCLGYHIIVIGGEHLADPKRTRDVPLPTVAAHVEGDRAHQHGLAPTSGRASGPNRG